MKIKRVGRLVEMVTEYRISNIDYLFTFAAITSADGITMPISIWKP